MHIGNLCGNPISENFKARAINVFSAQHLIYAHTYLEFKKNQ